MSDTTAIRIRMKHDCIIYLQQQQYKYQICRCNEMKHTTNTYSDRFKTNKYI